VNKQKAIIILTVFIDVLGLGIIIPVLPFYLESFGAGPIIITSLFAVFSLFSFLSAPYLGSLSDKIGRRPVLIVSILSTAIGWIVFAAGHALWVLFLGRIIDGLAAGNFSIAQNYLVDISKNEKERANNLGIIGMIFGIGFILGPMLGGLLSAVSHAFPFWVVGFMALANAVLAYFFLPETNLNKDTFRKISVNPFTPIITAVKDKRLISSYIVWFLFSMAAVLTQSIFALFVGERFNIGSTGVGIILTGMGLILALNQGVGIKHFWLKKFKESQLLLWMSVVFGLGYAVMSLHIFTVFIIGLVLNSFGQSVLRVVITSEIVANAEITRRGEVLGITSSIMSLTAIFGPLIAGVGYAYYPTIPYWISVGCVVVSLIFILKNRKMYDRPDLPEDINVEPLV
jgi:DHA1 family tetracycline resistance protein-like MFS transporter